MSKVTDLRKLKDQAFRALEKRNYAKAAEYYLEIAQHEEDPDWRQRAGEALRKAGEFPQAVTQLTLAADGYARSGFLLKAIAVCKVVLQIEPAHTETQAMLARLFAQKEGRPATPPVLQAPPAPAPVRPPPIPAAPPVAFELDAVDAVGIDELAQLPRTTPAIPPGKPMDVLPLASVLGGRPSQSVPVVNVSDYGVELTGEAYEIQLDVEAPAPVLDPSALLADAEERPQLRPLPITGERPVVEIEIIAEATGSKPAPRLPVTPPGDEMDFSSVMDDSAPLPKSVHIEPARPKAPPPLAVAPPGDEMDFSSVMDDSAPLPPSPRVSPAAPPAAQLPKIPLFSSLAEDELRRLIEGVEVRDFEEGDTILKQGESGVALYVVVRGEVEVLLEGPPQKTIATLGEGAFFGEMALLTDFPRSATVIAAAPTQCLEISRELAARVIADSPEVLKTLLRFFRDRMLDRFLATSELFGRFAPEDARALVDRFKFLEADPRTRLVKEGQRAPGLFLLLCGEAQVVQSTQPIAKLSPGDAFGEMSLLTRGPAIASIDTVTKCWVLELPSASFQEMMLTHPQLLEWVSELAERRRTQNLRGPEGRVDIL